MSDVVVDASLAGKWVVREPYMAGARALLVQWETDGVRRVVPRWFACEVGNFLYKRILRGMLTVNQAQVSLDVVLGHVVMLDEEPPLTKRALELADALNQPASYDTHYVALAEHLGCEVWTADERFWNGAKGSLPRVRWIGEVASP